MWDLLQIKPITDEPTCQTWSHRLLPPDLISSAQQEIDNTFEYRSAVLNIICSHRPQAIIDLYHSLTARDWLIQTILSLKVEGQLTNQPLLIANLEKILALALIGDYPDDEPLDDQLLNYYKSLPESHLERIHAEAYETTLESMQAEKNAVLNDSHSTDFEAIIHRFGTDFLEELDFNHFDSPT